MADKTWKVKLIGDSSNAESAMDRLHHKASTLGKVVAVGMSAAVLATAALGTQMVKGAGEVEKYRAVLETVTGSAAAAGQKLDWLRDFAKSTPFELPGLMEATTRLEAYGLKAEDHLRILGDTAAAMGKPVMAAVEAIADAQTGEFERIKEFGIKAVQEGGQTFLMYTDKAGQEQKTLVDRNNRQMVTSTIEAIWNEKYAGAMDKMSKTWEGMISNLKDSWNSAMADVGAEIIPQLKPALEQITAMLSSDEFKASISSIGQAFVSMGPLVELVGKTLFSLLKDVSAFLPGVFERITPLIDRALQAFLPLLGPILSLGEVLTGVILSAVEAILPVIEALAPILGRVVEKVAGFLEKSSPLITKIFDAISQVLIRALERLEPYLDRIIDAVIEVLDAVLPVLPQLIDFMGDLLSVVMTLAAPLLTLATNAGVLKVALMALLAIKVSGWVSGVSSAITGIGPKFSQAGSAIMSFANAAASKHTTQGLAGLANMSVSTGAAIGIIGAAATAAGIALNKMANDLREAQKAEDEAAQRANEVVGTNQINSAREAALAYGALKDSLDHTSEKYQGYKKSLVDIGVAEETATQAAALMASGRKEGLHAINAEYQKVLAAIGTEKDPAALSALRAQAEQLKGLMAGARNDIIFSLDDINTAVDAAVGNLGEVPLEVSNALASSNEEFRANGVEGMGRYVEGMMSQIGVPPEQAAEMAALTRDALSSQDPAVRDNAGNAILAMANEMAMKGTITFEQAALIGANIRAGLDPGPSPREKMEAMLLSLASQLESATGWLGGLARALGASIRKGIEDEQSPNIAFKVPATYNRMFASLKKEFEAGMPPISAQMATLPPVVPNMGLLGAPGSRRRAGGAGLDDGMPRDGAGVFSRAKGGGVQININIDNMYGEREYVRMLAREITKEMPNVEFARWSRV